MNEYNEWKNCRGDNSPCRERNFCENQNNNFKDASKNIIDSERNERDAR